ncbi:hypothetical protein L6452_42185 [Arctium lappa]|uniref:Uncharacterized protein n=1 Tax=Arctium lappa TaxID=4217 RepID=A0ACB8XHS9_ARCLA|nr:hypothetical protein L6452_42185 [Arctium lappa]
MLGRRSVAGSGRRKARGIRESRVLSNGLLGEVCGCAVGVFLQGFSAICCLSSLLLGVCISSCLRRLVRDVLKTTLDHIATEVLGVGVDKEAGQNGVEGSQGTNDVEEVHAVEEIRFSQPMHAAIIVNPTIATRVSMFDRLTVDGGKGMRVDNVGKYNCFEKR